MAKLGRAHPPGKVFNYNTGETSLAGFLVERAVHKPLAQYLSEKIWKTIGAGRDAVWMDDIRGHEIGGCCLSMTLRDAGRFGQFILDGGEGNDVLTGGPGNDRLFGGPGADRLAGGAGKNRLNQGPG